ncbi:MAG: XRE family transcriptional regulator [Bacteroidales bacterium]|jgi:transcriptional regulator with XRE-family HTH domain|nr:XRE family transcriptional regulator [Bacteroidales bacterium]
MGVKERVKEFVKYRGITDREFCLSIGVSFSYVNSIRKSIQPDKMKTITEVYPELNPVWLITGDGDMIIDRQSNKISHLNTAVTGNGNRVNNNDIKDLIELQKGYQAMIKEKDEQIKRLISIVEKLSDK